MPAEGGSGSPIVLRFRDGATLAEAAADLFLESAEEGIERRGRAAVALSGGRTPEALFRLLAEPPRKLWSGWPRTHFFWADERAIGPEHADSNYRLAREFLLSRVPVPEGNVHRMRGELSDLEREAARYADLLSAWQEHGRPRLDLVILGLGSDGHTASLFPGSPVLEERERLVAPAPGPPPHRRRITLTFPAINAARAVVFLVTGSDKAAAVREALEGEAAPSRCPARSVQPESGRLYWLLDEEAASLLSERV